jgi:surface antigen
MIGSHPAPPARGSGAARPAGAVAPAFAPSGGAGAAGAGAGAAGMAAAGGAFGLAEAEMVGRAFLASPAATRVAAGRSTDSMLAVVSLYNDAAGRPCRVVEQTVMINATPVRARGNMCREDDGRWALSPTR